MTRNGGWPALFLIFLEEDSTKTVKTSPQQFHEQPRLVFQLAPIELIFVVDFCELCSEKLTQDGL